MKIVKVEVPYDIRQEEIVGAEDYKLSMENGYLTVLGKVTYADGYYWNAVAVYSPDKWITARVLEKKI